MPITSMMIPCLAGPVGAEVADQSNSGVQNCSTLVEKLVKGQVHPVPMFRHKTSHTGGKT